MTCREKLKIEHPECVNKKFTGGCEKCPHDYGYLTKAQEDMVCSKGFISDALCGECWDTEIPETPSVAQNTTPALDNVNHPSHYETGKVECIDAMIETQGKEQVQAFCVCNAFKYLWRHRSKNQLEDVKKAIWYLNKFVELEDSK